jgi:type II secretory pathway component GspD/PulD (secretin)
VPQVEFEFNEETGTTRAVGLAEPLEFGTKILVTPQVNAAGFINLNITPEVSNQIGIQETEFGDQPILSSRKATTNVMIKDGYTLALGGLTQNENTKNGTKVPLLGDLPGVGRLFRSDSDELSQRNLIIFITARTLNPDGSTYRDIVDPRKLDEMGITPADLPGYKLPEDQKELLEQLENYRVEKEISEAKEEAKARIKRIEYAKQQAEEERASEKR